MTIQNNYSRRQFLQYSSLGLAAAALPQWVSANQSPVQRVATANFNPDVELEMTAREGAFKIFSQGQKTQMYYYQGKVLKGDKSSLRYLDNSYLSPLISLQKGQKVRVHFNNQIQQPSIIHWHGMHVPQHSDGHPMYAINPQQSYVYEFEVMNNAGTNFYHSHTHELTGGQVYRGLSGMMTVTDEKEQSLGLPTGEYDLPLVIQDKTFDRNNQLVYIRRMPERMMGFLGEKILVNGKPSIEFSVKTRAYRFRTLNASNSRIYKLAWDDGTPLVAIGTDGNLLPKPETRPYIMLAPAERVDLWLDFSNRPVGSQLVMYSLPFDGTMPRMGMMGRMGGSLSQGSKFVIARFKVTEKVSDSPTLPKTLMPIKRFTDNDVDNANNPIPIALSMGHMAPRLNGREFAMGKVMDIEKVAVGSHKKIKIFHEGGMGMRGGRRGMGMMGGMMNMAHPIHLHGQQYQVISRNTANVSSSYATVKEGFIDSGWKDTVLVMPNEEVEIIKPFEDYTGFFLYHCHNLEHEDLGMMRQFYVS